MRTSRHRPVLSEDEEFAWTQLHIIAQCLQTVMEQQLRDDAGVGYYEYAVLLTLYRQPDRAASMKQLTAITAGSFSRLSHTITRMADRDLVTRERTGGSRLVTLTELGHRTFLSAAAGHMDQIRVHVLDHVRADKLVLLGDILQPVADHLRSALPRG